MYSQIMDENNTTNVDCETSLKMKKPKFGWDNRSFMVFMNPTIPYEVIPVVMFTKKVQVHVARAMVIYIWQRDGILLHKI